MIPLLYQLSYTGTDGEHSVNPRRCPVEPTSSGPEDVQNPPGVLAALKNLLVPVSCNLCPQPPLRPSQGSSMGTVGAGHPQPDLCLCASCSEDLPEIAPPCPRCLQQPGNAPSDCPGCARASPSRPLLFLGPHQGSLRRWVLWAKHGNRLDLCGALGRELCRQWKRAETESDAFSPFGNPVLVPIPRSFWGTLLRGQPLSRSLTLSLKNELGFRERLLLRQIGRGRQTSRSAHQRRRMPLSRFQIKTTGRKGHKPDSEKYRVILVDDVLTTGTTLKVATRVLESAGYPVIAWVVASVTPTSGKSG